MSSEGRGLPAEPLVAYHHLPFFDGPASDPGRRRPEGGLDQIYLAMLRFAKAPIARALETLAASPGAAVFHCAAGKDRTGVLSAVVLGALGVVDADIVEDYALHAPRAARHPRAAARQRGLRLRLQRAPARDAPRRASDHGVAARARARAEWGSLRDYARDAGASDDALAELAARLLA